MTLLEQLMEADEVNRNGFLWQKLYTESPDWRGTDIPVGLRVAFPAEGHDDDRRGHVYAQLVGTLETMFSDSTNDDACRITVTETSAHFQDHFHDHFYRTYLKDVPFGSLIVMEATIDDWLT